MSWRVVITEEAQRHLASIKDRRIQAKIKAAILGLTHQPDEQGKPLIKELAGYRSLRAVGQRYRIIYRLEAEVVTVYVVLVGIRKEDDTRDVYTLAKKLLKQGLLSPTGDENAAPE